MANILNVNGKGYNLDDYEFIHVYNFASTFACVKKIGLVKDPTANLVISDNYDWVLEFREVSSPIYGEEITNELLINRELFKYVETYVESHPKKHIQTKSDGAYGCDTFYVYTGEKWELPRAEDSDDE
jgi:hypothetical protein